MDNSLELRGTANDPRQIFVFLLTGLNAYLSGNHAQIPQALRHAMSAIALQQQSFPKTLQGFIQLCHQPLHMWYTLPIPSMFDPTQPILAEKRLSDGAHEYCILMSEEWGADLLSGSFSSSLPEGVIENALMVELQRRLRRENTPEAQQMYVDIRSFLIEHSYCTPGQLRKFSHLFDELKVFYDEIPPEQFLEMPVCERCGLLEWHHDAWHGVKPEYCSDHHADSPYVEVIPIMPKMQRLKRWIHIRTFLPGQAELALFKFAEEKEKQFPDQLVRVERYPGFDTYDLRLTFHDVANDISEIWAVDVKDHVRHESFFAQVAPFYNEGNLKHDCAFYVVPDARLDDWEYARAVSRKIEELPRKLNLHILSVSGFQKRIEDKIEQFRRSVDKSGRKSKRKGS